MLRKMLVCCGVLTLGLSLHAFAATIYICPTAPTDFRAGLKNSWSWEMQGTNPKECVITGITNPQQVPDQFSAATLRYLKSGLYELDCNYTMLDGTTVEIPTSNCIGNLSNTCVFSSEGTTCSGKTPKDCTVTCG